MAWDVRSMLAAARRGDVPTGRDVLAATRMVAVAGVLGCGCGPRSGEPPPTDASWLVGVYSLQLPGSDALDGFLDRLTFEENGSAAWQKIARDRVVEERPMTWELETDQEAFVYPSSYTEGEDSWHIVRPGIDCNTLVLTYVDPQGHMSEGAPLYRGEVCAWEPDPEFHAYYERYWCDEPPPPCDDP